MHQSENHSSSCSTGVCRVPSRPWSSWWELTTFVLLVLIVGQALSRLGLQLSSPSASADLSLWAIMLVGFVAASSSCLAVVAGLLLSLSASWGEARHDAPLSVRLQPLLYFNVGRVVGYAVLGGLMGQLGASLALSVHATGLLTIALSAIMVLLGLRLLGLLPHLPFAVTMPGPVQRALDELTLSPHPVSAMVLGALTFFVPCGFTQSMQLVALSSGSFLHGALIMGAFAVGTLPALLGLSLLGAAGHGGVRRHLVTFSSVAVVIIGLMSIESGLVLTGIQPFPVLAREITTEDPFVTIDADGRQVITLEVTPHGYEPSEFTIQPGRETWVKATREPGTIGCTSVLTAPSFGISSPLALGENWLGPIRDPEKDFLLSCSMGTTNATVHVAS